MSNEPELPVELIPTSKMSKGDLVRTNSDNPWHVVSQGAAPSTIPGRIRVIFADKDAELHFATDGPWERLAVSWSPCSYPGCSKPTAYLPHADGGAGSGWRHVDPRDEVDSHVGYPMSREETVESTDEKLLVGVVAYVAGHPGTPLGEVQSLGHKAPDEDVRLALETGYVHYRSRDALVVTERGLELLDAAVTEPTVTCAYYRGVGTCSFGCQGPDGPACYELGAPGREALAVWRQLGLEASDDVVAYAEREAVETEQGHDVEPDSPDEFEALLDQERMIERTKIATMFTQYERANREGERGGRFFGFANRARYRLERYLGMIEDGDIRQKTVGEDLHWDDLDRCCWVGPRQLGQPLCDRPFGHHWEGVSHGSDGGEWSR